MRVFFTLLSISFFMIMWFAEAAMIEKIYYGIFCVVCAGVSIYYPEIEAKEFE